MSRRDNQDQAALLDIVEAGENIAAFIEGMDAEGFRRDKKTQAAVQHQIMLLGEAAKHLSPAFREEHPDIPWNLIARMRDRLIHGYATVDIDVVWVTATESVPRLLQAIKPFPQR